MSATGYATPTDVHGSDEPPASHRTRTLVLIGVGVVVVAAIAVWVVAFSSLFGVGSVQVKGTTPVTAATANEVRAAADISDGTPLVRLDTAAITRRVEQLPEIASAQVSTSFPSTVTITVTERTPVGYVSAGGHVSLVDSTGAQYRQVAKAPTNLPHFVVPTGAAARQTAAALGTVAGALPAKVRAVVTSIQALDPTSITLTTRSGTLIQWGSSSRSADKARLLPVLLAKHPSQIDVTDPEQPYIH